MIERLSNEVLADQYFNQLFLKANKLLAGMIFKENGSTPYLSPKELNDILRFSDILSNSKSSIPRNKAYTIITLLNPAYSTDPYYKTFSHSVLAKLGNFPGIDYLKNKNDNNAVLPYERAVEKTVKEFIQAVPDTSNLIFTDSQFELYQRISESKFFSFSGPTSMGKSFIIKSFIRKAISNSPPENIAILVPTRALISQFSLDLNRELKDLLEHYKYKVITNSNIGDMLSNNQVRYLMVLTPERLISYLSNKNNPLIGYLFVDEAHKLATENDSRAITAYNAISKTLRINTSLNLYFASPNVANPEVFLRLFKKDDTKAFRTIESPVSQNLFFLDLTTKKAVHYTDEENYEFSPKTLLNSNSLSELLVFIGHSENNIVYCSSRFKAVDKSLELFLQLEDTNVEVSNNVKKAIRQIKSYIHKDYYLADFLQKGIAYHFGNLPQLIRNKVEALFKESEIHYVFCTSTLLEGVNLPAKNVFILNDKNGRNPLQPIDFWNLAGRAGRLKYELSGNIFCIRETSKDWEKINLLNRNQDITLTPSIENHIDKQLKKIEQIINQTPDIKFKTESFREILEYIANVISIDTLEIQRTNYQSDIIKKLISENKEQIINLAKEKTRNIEVPSTVLSANQSVKVAIQNSVYQYVKANAGNSRIKLPSEINFESCKEWLNTLYNLFRWETEEKRNIKSQSQLTYYAMLMNQWINGTPLNLIISKSIEYFDKNKREIVIGWDFSKKEIFNKNDKRHVNFLIGEIIEDIEQILRFVFEKYFNNYYTILVEILGEENAGQSWATFLEYGTRNSIVIALQNYGLSRHTANYLFTKHRSSLNIEGDKLLGIDLKRLRIMLNHEDIEFDEIISILF
ncbi:MAG: DEAD/DEAH box helicase [Bacteroidetes bacterium]|nr:MAG: DEAD/DEAH box helicase [Bacteroidota bacterium]